MKERGKGGYTKGTDTVITPVESPKEEPKEQQNEYTGGDAQDVLRVAAGELGVSSGEKYWNFLFGGGYVNGYLTPFCACFDS